MKPAFRFSTIPAQCQPFEGWFNLAGVGFLPKRMRDRIFRAKQMLSENLHVRRVKIAVIAGKKMIAVFAEQPWQFVPRKSGLAVMYRMVIVVQEQH